MVYTLAFVVVMPIALGMTRAVIFFSIVLMSVNATTTYTSMSNRGF